MTQFNTTETNESIIELLIIHFFSPPKEQASPSHPTIGEIQKSFSPLLEWMCRIETYFLPCSNFSQAIQQSIFSGHIVQVYDCIWNSSVH